MTAKCSFGFCFKGSRTYVHGTDIYTQLTEYFGSGIKKIDLAFHGITVKNLSFYETKTDDMDIKVTFRCQLENGKRIKLFGIENNTNVNCRYEYMEEEIVRHSSVDRTTERISLITQTEYNFIEHIVAMNKALLENLYPDLNGKWYFTRLQLPYPAAMENINSLILEFKSNFQFKLTKTAIFVNNENLGYIYFSLIPKES